MSEQDPVPLGIDTTAPNVARIYDYLLWLAQWRPEPGTAPVGRLPSIRGGVGRKP